MLASYTWYDVNLRGMFIDVILVGVVHDWQSTASNTHHQNYSSTEASLETGMGTVQPSTIVSNLVIVHYVLNEPQEIVW